MLKIARYDKYDEEKLENMCRNNTVWLVMRSLPNSYYLINNFKNLCHVPELSPSTKLFYEYLDMKKKGQWNRDAFNNIYVPQFISEMVIHSRDILNGLYKAAATGDIILACACRDESLCHRSILMGLMQGAEKKYNHKKITECNTDYSEYYDLYLQEMNKMKGLLY